MRRRWPADGSMVVVDVETDGLEPTRGCRPFLIGAEDESGYTIMADCYRNDKGRAKGIKGREALKKIRRVVESESIQKIAHNAKFEIRMFRSMGWKPAGEWIDTMNLTVMLDEYSKLGLKFLANRHLNVDYEERDTIDRWLSKQNKLRRAPWLKKLREKHKKTYGQERVGDIPQYHTAVVAGVGAPPEATFRDFYESTRRNARTMRDYLQLDLDCTMRLAWMMLPPVMKSFAVPFKTETDLVPFVADMEDAGIMISEKYALERKAFYRKAARIEERKMYRAAGRVFNANSPMQLMEVLGRLGYDVPNTRKMTLNSLKGVFPKRLLEYRANVKMSKWFQTLLESRSPDGLVHARFWQNGEDEGIKTGRFSITEPGLQTLPGGYRGTVGDRGKDVRRCIVPRRGYNLFSLDYAQVEPRVLAHYTQEPRLLKSLKSGIDIYLAFVRIFFGKAPFKKGAEALKIQRRSDAKTVILAITYGMGVSRMAAALGVTDVEAKGMRAKCFQEMPLMKDLMDDCMKEVGRRGHIDDCFGRRYRVPRDLSYKAINAIIQGAAAAIMKRALIDCGKAIQKFNRESPACDAGRRVKRPARMLLTVHDEILFEIPSGAEDWLVPLLAKAMANVAPEITVPLVADVSWGPHGESWGNKEDWKPGDAKRKRKKKSKSPTGEVAAIVGNIEVAKMIRSGKAGL